MQPFSGIRVLDFTHVLAGPFCTYQLAVMGADVVKIESPDRADMMRTESASEMLASEGLGTQYLSQSANKRSLAIDIGSADGVEIVKQLVVQADVLVENFRSGVLAAAGLGYEALADINPLLIYCSMTGYGQTGPKALHPAYDNVIQAFSGLMAATGSVSTAPVRVGPPVLDYGTGAQAAFAIASALFQRSRNNKGQFIDVAMLDAALMLMSSAVVDSQVHGAAPTPPGNSSLVNAAYGCFEASDGLIMIGGFTGRQRADLWRVLRQNTSVDDGTNDLQSSVDFVHDQASAPARSQDTVSEETVLREQDIEREAQEHLGYERLSHAEKVEKLPIDRAQLQQMLKQQPAQFWEDVINEAGVPAARVRGVDETLTHPQLDSRQVLQSAQGLPEDYADLQVPIAAFSFLHNGPTIQQHAAKQGQHSREVLREIGLDDRRISQLEQDGIVLQAQEDTAH